MFTMDVLPDGDCMFRSFYHHLHGHDEHHVQVREVCYRKWSNITVPHTSLTSLKHTQKVACGGSWATQLDFQAGSDCFNMEGFVCSPRSSTTVTWDQKERHHLMELVIPPRMESSTTSAGVFGCQKKNETLAFCDHSPAQSVMEYVVLASIMFKDFLMNTVDRAPLMRTPLGPSQSVLIFILGVV